VHQPHAVEPPIHESADLVEDNCGSLPLGLPVVRVPGPSLKVVAEEAANYGCETEPNRERTIWSPMSRIWVFGAVGILPASRRCLVRLYARRGRLIDPTYAFHASVAFMIEK
jgi:hypothetical protein